MNEAGASEIKANPPRPSWFNRWWNNIPLAGKGIAVVAVPLASLVGSLIAFFLASSTEHEQQSQVRRSLAVQTQIRKVLANAVDSETGVRGYLFTGRDDLLEPYHNGSQALPENIRILTNLLADDPLQTQPMQRLEKLLTQRLQILNRALKEIAPQTGPLTAEQQDLVREGKTVMDQIRSSIQTIENGAQGLLSSRLARLQRANTLLSWIFAASSVAGILGGAFSVLVFSRSIARRIGVLQENATRLADGLPIVPAGHNGHDEIGHLSMGLEKSAALLAERNQSLQAEREQLAATVAAQQEIATVNDDLDPTLRLILHYAESLLGGQGAALSFVNGDHLVLRVGIGISAAHVGMVVKPKTSFSGLCAKTGEVLRCDDSETDDRVDREACRSLGARSVLTAPFRHDGTVLGALSVVSTEPHKFRERDISTIQLMASLVGVAIERDRAQRTLRVSEERFRQLSESVRDVFWIISADKGELLYANRAYEKIWGSAADLVLGSPWKWAEAIHVADRDRVLKSFREKAAVGDYSDEFRVVRPDGSIHWVSIQGAPVREDSGEVRRIAGIASDITLRKETAAALEDAKREAERANRAKSEFLSRMSHELRTPLNAILGFGQLLELDNLSADSRESTDQILRAGRHLLDLINELLDISRIETGEMTLSLEPVHLRSIVEDCLDLVNPIAEARHIQIIEKLDLCQEHHVVADQQRLKQVLLNLLANAVKYNRERGQVTIRCEKTPPDFMRLEISDTGFGISPENLKRLFRPFDRLDAEGTGVEGTGLGLAISKRLVEMVGGRIGVESIVGVGSTFWMELRLAENPLPHSAEAAPPLKEIDEPPAASVPTRAALYIEDNLSNLKLIQRVFAQRSDWKLLTAAQGSLGIELACEHRPDLILLDLNLPDIPGHEVLHQLQHNEDTRDIPVVVISADASPASIERGFKGGARDYLTKPLVIPRLLELLDTPLLQAAHV